MVSGFYRDDKLSLNMNNSLSFKKKTFRIDWRKIAAVDLDRIAKELDVYTLQENIDHITFCNIENEIDTRMMDPNFIKLFKLCQYTIEYLMHSQSYLTDVISTIESQLNISSKETEDLKKTNEKLQKDLTEVRKENKKRKKLIETQQTLMNATASNYHQCAYCSKVFLNISYLQAHMTRRHPEISQFSVHKQNSEIEKELERIKERLRLTENDLMLERNSRLTVNSSQHHHSHSPSNESVFLLKQLEEQKNSEIKRQKDELRRVKDGLKKEINELNDKNSNFERTIKDLQERLGKQSHVGWMKDDIDVDKDTALKQKQEIDRLNQLLASYQSQVKEIEELKSKWRSKEESLKKKIVEKDEKIAGLKARLAELENAANKTDNELVIRNNELIQQLEEEKQLRYQLERELAELKNRPPPVTPRQPQPSVNRTPSPPKPVKKEASHTQQRAVSSMDELIYLPEYCPLTLAAVQKNPNHLQKYKEYAIQLFEKELDEMGIDLNEKGLSQNDFRQKMNIIKNNRPTRTDNLTAFNELRRVFMEISDKYSSQRLNSSLRSSIGNRVTFKSQLEQSNSKRNNYDDRQSVQLAQQYHQVKHVNKRVNDSRSQFEESEETDDDVSISNALESEDDDDTEPTKSFMNESPVEMKQQQHRAQNNYHNKNEQMSPVKKRLTDNINPDDLSDLESLSQLLTDRSAKSKNPTIAKMISNSANKNSGSNINTKPLSYVDDTKRKLEKQLVSASKKNYRPVANAIPVGFISSSTKSKNQARDEESFSSVTDIDLENENKGAKPKNLRSSLQDSNSSSIWVSESHSNDVLLTNNQTVERPPTANSSKTLNFESDENER